MYFVTVILNVKSKCNSNYICKKQNTHIYIYQCHQCCSKTFAGVSKSKLWRKKTSNFKKKTKQTERHFNKTHPVSDGWKWYHDII